MSRLSGLNPTGVVLPVAAILNASMITAGCSEPFGSTTAYRMQPTENGNVLASDDNAAIITG
jgi:hypothetical protein